MDKFCSSYRPFCPPSLLQLHQKLPGCYRDVRIHLSLAQPSQVPLALFVKQGQALVPPIQVLIHWGAIISVIYFHIFIYSYIFEISNKRSFQPCFYFCEKCFPVTTGAPNILSQKFTWSGCEMFTL